MPRYHARYVSRPENREKLRCRDKVRNAIKSGKLVRLPCEKCGEPKTEAHHEDYSKPLDVIWLCCKCHRARHRGEPKAPWTHARRTHCPRGHAMTDENAVIEIVGGGRGEKRRCRQCQSEAYRRRAAAKSEK